MKTLENLLSEVRPEVDFNQSSDFFSDGLLDSFDLVLLVSSIDQAFGISIDGLDIKAEHFMNLEAMRRLLQRYGVG